MFASENELIKNLPRGYSVVEVWTEASVNIPVAAYTMALVNVLTGRHEGGMTPEDTIEQIPHDKLKPVEINGETYTLQQLAVRCGDAFFPDLTQNKFRKKIVLPVCKETLARLNTKIAQTYDAPQVQLISNTNVLSNTIAGTGLGVIVRSLRFKWGRMSPFPTTLKKTVTFSLIPSINSPSCFVSETSQFGRRRKGSTNRGKRAGNQHPGT